MPRPPSRDRHQAQTEQDVLSSNNTLNTLLGGKRKSWMVGHRGDPVRPTPRPQNPSSAQIAPAAVPQKQTAAVLPSPAPSDEPSPVMSHPHESPTIISSSLETQHTTPPAPSRLSSANGEPSRPQGEISRATTYDIQNGTAAEKRREQTTQLRTDFQTHVPSPQESQSHPSPDVRKEPHSRPASSQRPSSAVPPLPSTLLPTQPQVQSPTVVYNRVQVPRITGNSAREQNDGRSQRRSRNQAPIPRSLRPRIIFIDQKFQELGPAATQPDNLERPRLELLKNACNKEDLAYVALHQIFCVWSLRRANFPSIRGLPNDAIMESAFKIIGSLLRTNDGIALNHLQWFTNFPSPLEDLVRTSAGYAQALEDVGTFLAKLVSEFHIFERECCKRGYPPLVDEMVNRLGLCSTILQEVIYRYVRRNIGYRDDDLGLRVESVFEKDTEGHQRLAARYNTDRPPTEKEIRLRDADIRNQYTVLNQERIKRKRSAMSYASQVPTSSSQAPVGPAQLRSSSFGPRVVTSNTPNWSGPNHQYNQSPSSSGSPNVPNISMNSPLVPGQSTSSPHSNSPAQGFQWAPLILRSNSNGDNQYMPQQMPQQLVDSRNSGNFQSQVPMVNQQQVSSQQMPRQQPSTYSTQQRQFIDNQNERQILQQQAINQRQALEGQQSQFQAQQQAIQEQQMRMQQHVLNQRQAPIQASRQQLINEHQRVINQQAWIQQQQQQLQPVSQDPSQLQHNLQVQQDQNIQHVLAMNRARASQINHGQPPVLHTQAHTPSRNSNVSSSNVSPLMSMAQHNSMNAPPNMVRSMQVQPANHTYVRFDPINDPRAYASIPDPMDRPLIPPLNYTYPSQYPQPEIETLHQAHLRSPELLTAELTSIPQEKNPTERLYQTMTGFLIGPTKLPSNLAVSTFDFALPEADFALVAKDRVVGSEVKRSVSRELHDGTLQYRLRCIKTKPNVTDCQTADWAISDTVWPPTAFIEMNGHSLHIRRKAHHGKDLPIDITRYIASQGVGQNQVKVAVPRSRKLMQDVSYFFAVEVIEVIKHTRIIDRCLQSQLIPSATTVQSIQKALAATNIDDELTMVEDDLTINLADPFTAKIFETPVRGSSCLHRECFDLETFLMTRNSKLKVPKQPSMVDVWKCPLCGCDSRPSSLQVDVFLMSVRARLSEDNNLDVKSILVASDGTWRPKPEPEPVARKRKSDKMDASSDSEDDGPFQPRKKVALETLPEVIELDSD